MRRRWLAIALRALTAIATILALVAIAISLVRLRASYSASAQAEPQHKFRYGLRRGCEVPFARMATASDPMADCDNAGRIDGVPIPPLEERLRSDAKNNLCPTERDPVPISFGDIAALPHVDPSVLATSRSELRRAGKAGGADIGEGAVVRLSGRVSHAHVANCFVPEPDKQPGDAANCHLLGGVETSDIALTLEPIDGRSIGCGTVSARIIPHFRPASWSELDLKTPVPPVRVTGQLFYDDGSAVCGWEIHPVYAIDVCVRPDGNGCDPARDDEWKPYEEWLQQPDADVRPTGARERTTCQASALPKQPS